MKAILVSLLSVSSLAFSAVTKQEVNCSTPAGMSGNAAVVKGTLNLSQHPTYPAPAKKAEGELKVLIGGGSGRTTILNKNIQFMGQYDNVRGHKYATIGSKPDGKVTVYIDLNTKDGSYIEYKDKTYLMNCAH